MAHDHLKAHARRVVVDVDENGKSTFVSDGPTTTRLATDASTLNPACTTGALIAALRGPVPSEVLAQEVQDQDTVVGRRLLLAAVDAESHSGRVAAPDGAQQQPRDALDPGLSPLAVD